MGALLQRGCRVCNNCFLILLYMWLISASMSDGSHCPPIQWVSCHHREQLKLPCRHRPSEVVPLICVTGTPALPTTTIVCHTRLYLQVAPTRLRCMTISFIISVPSCATVQDDFTMSLPLLDLEACEMIWFYWHLHAGRKAAREDTDGDAPPCFVLSKLVGWGP